MANPPQSPPGSGSPPAPPRPRPICVCVDGQNCVDAGTIPIIFVPGIMGSRLNFPTLRQQWDPDSTWAMVHWARIGAERAHRELHFTTSRAQVMTTSKNYTADQNRCGWAGVTNKFYGNLLRALANLSFGTYQTPVYGVGYDWRQDNRVSADAAHTTINNILSETHANRFVLVSHSMGGLMTRSLLKRHSGLAQKLLGVVHIAQPVTGAVVLYRRMFTGAPADLDGREMSLILNNTRPETQTVVGAILGACQLFPTPRYRDRRGNRNEWWIRQRTFEDPAREVLHEGDAWALYRGPTSPPGIFAPPTHAHAINRRFATELRRRLANAQSFHSWLDVWKHDKTWAIYGTGDRTEMRTLFETAPLHVERRGWRHAWRGYRAQRNDGTTVVFNSDPRPAGFTVVRDAVTYRAEGDGTVPGPSGGALFPNQAHHFHDERSAQFATQRQFEVRGGAHDSICNHRNCQQPLFAALRHIIGS